MSVKKINYLFVVVFFILIVLVIILLFFQGFDPKQSVFLLMTVVFVISPLIYKKAIRKYLIPIQVYAITTYIIHLFIVEYINTASSLLLHFASLFFSLLWLILISSKSIDKHKEVKKRLDKYSRVIKKLPLAVVIHDGENIVYMNDVYRDYFGTDNILDKSMSSHIFTDCPLSDTKKSENDLPGVCKIKTRKGDIWCSFKTETIDEKQNYFITSILDHTDFVKTSHQVEELQDIEKRIFNSIPIGLAVISERNGIEFFNSNFKEFTAQNIVPLVNDDHRCPIKCNVDKCVLDSKEEHHEEFRDNKNSLVYALRCIPLEKGKEKESIVILRDITKEKNFTELLKGLSSSSNLLMRLSELITSDITGFEEYGQRIYEVIHDELQLCDHMFVAKKLDEENIFIEFGVIENEIVSGTTIPIKTPSLSKYIIEHSEPLYLSDIKASKIKSYIPEELRKLERPITFYGLPLRSNGETRGIVAFKSWGEDRFDESKKEIFTIIASQLEVLFKIQNNIESIYEERNKLEVIVLRDKLTGAYNRNFFDEYIRKLDAENKRSNENSSIVMLDVNDFKKINDQKGHVFGDKVLKLVSNVFKNTIREMDVFIRYGGDEFVIVLPRTSKEEAENVIKRASENLLKASTEELNMETTISYGISTLGKSQDYKKAINIADSKMYEMKNS
ncbi:MAG: sensor domain-containing diguanylate cyclase [Kosmotogaceae bacterium]